MADHSARKTVPLSVWGWGRLLNRGRLQGVSNTLDSVELTKYSTHEGWSASSRVYCSRESIKEIIQNETVKTLLGKDARTIP